MSEVGTKWVNATPDQEAAYEQDVMEQENKFDPGPYIDENMRFQIEYSARATAMQYADKFSETVDELLDNANKFYEFLMNEKAPEQNS